MKQLLHSALTLTTLTILAVIATTQATIPKEAVAGPILSTKVKPQIRQIVKPDLQVGVIKVLPQNPGEGQEVTFEGNVMNYGTAAARNPVVVMNVVGPAGTSFSTFRKEFNVTLNKNQGVTFVQKFIVPKPGNYTCTFKLDPARMIPETDDNNNEKKWSFGVGARADLAVCIDNGKRPPVGRSRQIKVVVKNVGHAASNHVAQTKLRFSVEGHGTKTYDIPSISPGQSHTITRSNKWSKSGTKTISAKVTYSHYEISKQNNEISGSYFVRLPHHDKYGPAPKVKCSTGANFNSWEQCNAQMP